MRSVFLKEKIMKIGILIAVRRELDVFLKSGESLTEEHVAGKTVYKTVMEGHEICAVQSGCGQIDAAAGTMLLIAHCGCDMVINYGVTGALEEELRVEDLFVVDRVCNYDYDTSQFDPVKPAQYMEYPDEFIPLDAGLVEWIIGKFPDLRKVADASGNRFVEEREEKLRLRAMGCSICDMELAAIARVCERAGVKCLSIKCISDTFDGTGADFNLNVTRSSQKVFGLLREVLKAL